MRVRLLGDLPETMDREPAGRRRVLLRERRDLVCALTIAALAGCSSAKTDGAGAPGQGSGSIADGGSGGSPTSSGGSSGSMGAGGSGSAPTGTTDATPPLAASSSGGSVTSSSSSSGSGIVPGDAGGSSSGGSSGAGTGASSGAAGSGGGSSGSSGGTAGSTCGDAGAPNYPLTAPVPDSASKVPVSNAGAGYTVEGNMAYGPLTAQRLDVIYPANAGPKGTQVLPAVVMFHGGGWIHSYNNGTGKDHMSTFFDRFLAHGFMVCNAEYRVADGTADGAVAPAAVEDALLAARWCWDHLDYYHGDRARYVVTGASAGGHLSLMVGMASAASMLGPTTPCDFKIAAIVDGYGIADVEKLVGKGSFTDIWLPSSLPNRAAVAKQVNPMTYVRMGIPPLIVVQGANDTTAPIADSQHLVTLLTAAGADATMHAVPGAGHGFATPATAWPDAEKAMFDWLVSKGIGK